MAGNGRELVIGLPSSPFCNHGTDPRLPSAVYRELVLSIHGARVVSLVQLFEMLPGQTYKIGLRSPSSLLIFVSREVSTLVQRLEYEKLNFAQSYLGGAPPVGCVFPDRFFVALASVSGCFSPDPTFSPQVSATSILYGQSPLISLWSTASRHHLGIN